MKIFCNQCGSENIIEDNFCVQCGSGLDKEIFTHNQVSNIQKEERIKNINPSIIKEEWWYRLLRVLYFVLYLPIFIIVPLVWMDNEPYCYNSYYYDNCVNQNGESFWYSLLTLIIYIFIIRLIKLSIKYIISGKEIKWREEFRRFY